MSAEPRGGDVRVVLLTAPDPGTAEELGRALVQEGLAACANLVPGVVSFFRWEGEVQRDDEILLVVKTTASGVERLRARAVALHPYDVPEVLVLPVSTGHGPYLEWVRDEVGG